MRRHKQQLSQERSIHILKTMTSGVLALYDREEYPYAVPMSYVFHHDKLYFHCAKEGHKIEAIRHCPRVSFCVIEQDKVIPAEYTTYFRSVIVFGTIRIVENPDEQTEALRLLADKYAPQEDRFEDIVSKSLPQVCILEMTIERLTGKEAIELVMEHP